MPAELSTDDIKSVLNSMYEYGVHLGVDLKEILPDVYKILILPEQEYGSLVKRSEKYIPPDSNGYIRLGLEDIIVSDKLSRSKFQKLKTLTHELVHFASFRSYELGNRRATTTFQAGFSGRNQDEFRILDKGFTELTCWYVIKRFWKNQPNLTKYVSDLDRHKLLVNYYRTVVLVDMIILKVARSLDMEYVDVLNQLQRLHIKNPPKGIKMIEEVIGSEALSVIAKLPSEIDSDDSDDVFLKTVKSLPIGKEFSEINDGSGVYKFWDRF